MNTGSVTFGPRKFAMPTKDQLDYWRLLLTVALLALVFPMVLYTMVTNPKRAADRALGGAVPKP